MDWLKQYFEVARTWLSILSDALDKGYSTSESENFLILSNEDSVYLNTFSKFLERSRQQLLKVLPDIVNDEGHGKHVVIIFEDINSYYDYISFYGPKEGTFGLSSGMYLNYGYGHFVFPHQDIDYAREVAAHEMTHALLQSLPIPLWLDEGLAMNMERLICNIPAPRLNRTMYEKHLNFWDAKKIQEFWQGSSFSRADEGQGLSYDLAQILVNNLSDDYDAFVKFANQAHYEDGGEKAIENVFDLSLGDMIFNFLGEGDWWPEPETWENV